MLSLQLSERVEKRALCILVCVPQRQLPSSQHSILIYPSTFLYLLQYYSNGETPR